MNFDILTLLTFFAIILFAYTIGMMIRDSRRSNLIKSKNVQTVKEVLSDYDKIAKRTHGVERERQKNSGKHYNDESFYLNRAELIRSKTDFFTWVNSN